MSIQPHHGDPRARDEIWIDTNNGERLKVVNDGWDYVECVSADSDEPYLVQPSHFGKTLIRDECLGAEVGPPRPALLRDLFERP